MDIKRTEAKPNNSNSKIWIRQNVKQWLTRFKNPEKYLWGELRFFFTILIRSDVILNPLLNADSKHDVRRNRLSNEYSFTRRLLIDINIIALNSISIKGTAKSDRIKYCDLILNLRGRPIAETKNIFKISNQIKSMTINSHRY